MKTGCTLVLLLAAAIAAGRGLYVTALGDCSYVPPAKQGFEDPNEIVGKYLGGRLMHSGQVITFTIDLCINDPNLSWQIVGNAGPIDGQTVSFRGPVGIHYLYFQLQDTDDPNEPLDEATVAVKVVPRGQFKAVTW